MTWVSLDVRVERRRPFVLIVEPGCDGVAVINSSAKWSPLTVLYSLTDSLSLTESGSASVVTSILGSRLGS